MGQVIRAWHFVGRTLRDGTLVPPDGVKLVYPGHIKCCVSGYHASRDPFDALQYAPGTTLCLVDCSGEIIEQRDKLVASERKIIARMDATDLLYLFARKQALSVVHLWNPPKVVLDYLNTGDISLRARARDAARDAAWDAARDAVWDAAGDAAWAAAWAAAGDAAWAAAGDAARDAAWAAARQQFNEMVAEQFKGVL
jgi:hypothetical protein